MPYEGSTVRSSIMACLRTSESSYVPVMCIKETEDLADIESASRDLTVSRLQRRAG